MFTIQTRYLQGLYLHSIDGTTWMRAEHLKIEMEREVVKQRKILRRDGEDALLDRVKDLQAGDGLLYGAFDSCAKVVREYPGRGHSQAGRYRASNKPIRRRE